MITEAQRRAVAKYKKKALKRISFTLHKDNDADLIIIYESISNKQEWFREALRWYAGGGAHDNTSKE